MFRQIAKKISLYGTTSGSFPQQLKKHFNRKSHCGVGKHIKNKGRKPLPPELITQDLFKVALKSFNILNY